MTLGQHPKKKSTPFLEYFLLEVSLPKDRLNQGCEVEVAEVVIVFRWSRSRFFKHFGVEISFEDALELELRVGVRVGKF